MNAMDITKIRRLTRAEFRAWLASKNPRATVGRPRAHNACPIAVCHKAIFRIEDVSVSVYIVQVSWKRYTPPKWAKKFIDKVDNERTKTISAKRALELLDSIK